MARLSHLRTGMLSLRPFQQTALAALESDSHLILIAPTGSGKSLVYERAAARPQRRTLLVSPLIALARQQAQRLCAAGIRAQRVGAGETPDLEASAWIISPEKLESASFMETLRAWRPTFLVMDECHCLWEWGSGFRPSFREVPLLVDALGIRTTLWLTATLPPEARFELKTALPGPVIEQGAFGLPARLELAIERVTWPERMRLSTLWVRGQRAPGILFVPTRELARRWTRLLEATGKDPVLYHAGLAHEERRSVEMRVARGEGDVIVATSAFGMGMDYPHLEWALLWQAPTSLLALAQSIGRVGRGERPATARVFWDRDDFRAMEWAARSEPSRRRLREMADFLNDPRSPSEKLDRYFNPPDQQP